MALGRIEREVARICELGLRCPDLLSFQEGLLDILNHAIGFDKAVLNGYCTGPGEDIKSRGYDKPPGLGLGPQWMAELQPQELDVARRGPFVDVDLLSNRRRNQLSMYRECLWPEGIKTFILVIWRTGNGVFGINLARTGRGAQFLAKELRLLETLRPAIELANAHIRLEQRMRETSSFETWAAQVGLSAREREVAEQAVKGCTDSEIADRLGTSPRTIRNQLRSIFRKAEVDSCKELIHEVLTFKPSEHLEAKLLPWMKRMR